MGAYLSKPNTQKVSEDSQSKSKKLKFGASSMQGWRISQEDAHNCCLDFDEDISLFAVYDGHGGSEVANYTAENLPEFLKEMSLYKAGNFSEALQEAFLQFDATLTNEDVIETLKDMAGLNTDDNDEDEHETEKLTEEATMPIEELMKRYGYAKEKPSLRQNLRKKENIQSPIIRAKKYSDQMNSDTLDDNDRIKVKLDDQLVNGHSDVSDDRITSTKFEDQGVDVSTLREVGDISSSAEKTSTEVDTLPAAVVLSSDGGNVLDTGECGSSSGSSLARSSSAGGRTDDGHSAGRISAADCEESESIIPSSSSGRTCKQHFGIITTEGEESSFDESEEDTEEDSSEEDEPWKSSSDDEDDEEDDDDLGPFTGDDDNDEENEEIMTGGEDPGKDSGCTAVVALLRKDQIFVANAGDSRCVLCRNGLALDLSEDHKPEDNIERTRIEKAGGRITKDGRVNGGLNLSRAIGDHCYKQNATLPDRDQMITALPDITTTTIQEHDEFLILACDGIWNVMSSQDVVAFVRERLKTGVQTISSICEELFDLCLSPNTYGDGTGCDNMTCIIVTLGDHFKSVSNKHKADIKPESAVAAEDALCINTAEYGIVIESSDAKTKMTHEDSDGSSKRKAEDNSLNSIENKKQRTDEAS